MFLLQHGEKRGASGPRTGRDVEAAFSGALRSKLLQAAGEIGGTESSREALSERFRDSAHAGSGFVHEFQAEMADSRREPIREMRAGFLGLGSKNGVAAADVGDHGVGSSGSVAQCHLMFLAGAAGVVLAVRIAFSRRRPLDLIAGLAAPVAVVVAILGLLLVLVPGFLG